MPSDEPEVAIAKARRTRDLDLDKPLVLASPIYKGSVIQTWRNGKVVGRVTMKNEAWAGDIINLKWHSDGSTVSVRVV
jgi:hypothetical protein